MFAVFLTILIPVLKGFCLQTLTWTAYSFQREQLKGDNVGATMSIAFQQSIMAQVATVSFSWAYPGFSHSMLLTLTLSLAPLIIGLYAGGLSTWYNSSPKIQAALSKFNPPLFIKKITGLLTHPFIIKGMTFLHPHVGTMIAAIQIYLLVTLTWTAPIISAAAFFCAVLNFARIKNIFSHFLSKKIEQLNRFLEDFSSIFLFAYNPMLFLFSLYNIIEALLIRFASPFVLRKILGEDSDFIKLSETKEVTKIETKIPRDIPPETLKNLLSLVPETPKPTHPDIQTELWELSTRVGAGIDDLNLVFKQNPVNTNIFSRTKTQISKAASFMSMFNNIVNKLEKEKTVVLDPTHITYTLRTPQSPKIDFKQLEKTISKNLHTYEGLQGACRSSIKFQKAGGDALYEELLTLNQLQKNRAAFLVAKAQNEDIAPTLEEKNKEEIDKIRNTLKQTSPQKRWEEDSDVLVEAIKICKDKIAASIKKQQNILVNDNAQQSNILSRFFKKAKNYFKKTEAKPTSDNVYVSYVMTKIQDYLDRIQHGTKMLNDKSIEIVVDFQNQGRFLLDYCEKLLQGAELIVTDKAPDKTTIKNLQKATFFRFGSTLLFIDIDQKRTRTEFEIDDAAGLDTALELSEAQIGFKKTLTENDYNNIAVFAQMEQPDPKQKALGILVSLAIEAGDFCADAVIDETQKQYSMHLEESLLTNPAEQMASFLRNKREEVYETIYAQWLEFLATDLGMLLKSTWFPTTDFEDKHVKSTITHALSALRLQSSENAKHTLSSKKNRTFWNKLINDILAYLITRTLMVTENGYGPQLFMKDFKAALLRDGAARDANNIRKLFNSWVDHFQNQETRELMLSILDPYSDINERGNKDFIDQALNKVLSLMFYDTSACKFTKAETENALLAPLKSQEAQPPLSPPPQAYVQNSSLFLPTNAAAPKQTSPVEAIAQPFT